LYDSIAQRRLAAMSWHRQLLSLRGILSLTNLLTGYVAKEDG